MELDERASLAGRNDEAAKEDTAKEANNKTPDGTASAKETPDETPNNNNTKETPNDTPQNDTASTRCSYKRCSNKNGTIPMMECTIAA
jgi:hypothetical protein